MDRVKINTAQNVYIDYEAAGVGDRAIAAIFDGLILVSYFILMTALLGENLSPGVMALISIPYILYFLLSEIFLNGQTIGKKARGIKVTRIDGTEPGPGDYVIRWLFRFVEIDICMGLIALLTLIFRGNGQRLGDMAARTTVVKISRKTTLDQTFYTGLEADYEAQFREAALLTDKDISLAKEVLDTIKREGPSPQNSVLGDKMKATLERKMAISSPLPATDFLDTLIKDYNYLKR